MGKLIRALTCKTVIHRVIRLKDSNSKIGGKISGTDSSADDVLDKMEGLWGNGFIHNFYDYEN